MVADLNRRDFFKGLFATVVVARLPLQPLPEPIITISFSECQYLMRSNIWGKAIKKVLLEELTAMKFTDILDGD